MLSKWIYSIHRVLGAVLCFLFLVWFLSGFVMIFSSFPSASHKDLAENKQIIDANSSKISALGSILEEGEQIRNLSLEKPFSRNIFKIQTNKGVQYRYADNLQKIERFDVDYATGVAFQWNHSGINHMDTLYHLEQWIPSGRLKKDFPIYKFYFDDPDKSQLYISSRTGEVLQYTNQTNRFWAWLGAIPHWVYFTFLRQNSTLWSSVVSWMAGVGCIMCLGGIYAGIKAFVINRKKKKKGLSPYKKFDFKWHHITGFIFGFFVFSWVFSGLMSLNEIPQWISRSHKDPFEIGMQFRGKTLDLNVYTLDFQKIVQENESGVKKIEWSSFQDIPIYKIRSGEETSLANASFESVNNYVLDEATIRQAIESIHGKNSIREIVTMDEYDNYYISRKMRLPLPVYKVIVNDADNSVHYFNPKTLQHRYYNNNERWKRWTYQGLHCFDIAFLVNRPVLWYIVMFTFMIGGTLVSLTGVILGFKYIKRKLR